MLIKNIKGNDTENEMLAKRSAEHFRGFPGERLLRQRGYTSTTSEELAALFREGDARRRAQFGKT